jgi:cytochrome c553
VSTWRTIYALMVMGLLLLAAVAVSTRGRAGDMVDMTGVEPWDTCGECHGLDGTGNQIKFPRIAGQRPSYIISELRDFRAGRRKNDDGQMQQMATDLAEADFQRVAEWFASQAPPWPKPTIEAEPDLARARELATLGIGDIPACLSCHSAASLGALDLPVDAPRIAGQRDYYIVKELNDFRDGRRNNDFHHIMSKVARGLRETDIISLAIFLSQNPDLHELEVP